MRYFLRRGTPRISRILLIESGSRSIAELVIPRLRSQFGRDIPIDLVTCLPAPLPDTARSYNVNQYRGRALRFALTRELRANAYPVVAIICSDEPILNKWKWALTLALPSKFLVVNENADYFWLDRGQWPTIRRFIKYRAGWSDAGVVRAAARFVAFPFTFSYLLIYAAAVHVRRALFRGFR